ncbi:12517_t:CDS:2 [Cetraspora pellucida]|uniref:12517_t:CDS:1 n=1 Tax=Cetraspora pellucida TaxID=1433469 RepID=A0ACA9K5C4_9GLOM|nr:12517_t:CDS:2 [Cetraspora pellucida]
MFLVTFKPIKSRLNEIEQEMKHIIGSWNGIPLVFEEFHHNSLNDLFFKFLTPRDLNTFLGLRTTLGSAIQLPPSLPECLAAFTQRYVKKNTKLVRASISNKLTVGAKAFSKHCHRDTSGSFWGVCSGTEEQKNEQANKVLAKILTNAAWINLHSLPHNTRVFEVRNLDGYGARWEIREPQCQQLQSQLQTDSSDTTNSFNSSDGTNIMFLFVYAEASNWPLKKQCYNEMVVQSSAVMKDHAQFAGIEDYPNTVVNTQDNILEVMSFSNIIKLITENLYQHKVTQKFCQHFEHLKNFVPAWKLKIKNEIKGLETEEPKSKIIKNNELIIFYNIEKTELNDLLQNLKGLQ